MSLWLRLKARDRRALLLAVIVVSPFAAYRFGVSPWLQRGRELRSVLESERDLLSREMGAVREGAELPERTAALEMSFDAVAPWLLPGSNPVAASGALSRYVTDLAVETAILVQEAESREGEEAAGPLQTASLTVRAQGDLEGLVRFLHALENGTRLVRVEALSLRTAGVNDGDLERGQLMTADLIITGYWVLPDRGLHASIVGSGGVAQ